MPINTKSLFHVLLFWKNKIFKSIVIPTTIYRQSAYFLCLFIFLLSQCQGIFAQDSKTLKLQAEVKACIAKSYAATVFLADYDTLKKVNTGERFSGVVISKDGLIMTAAHVEKPGQVYQVIFPDGRHFTATGLGRIQAIDAAILQINEKGILPYAELGWSSLMHIKEPCVSIAYPGSFLLGQPIIRYGYVEDIGGNGRQMRTSCLMEPGDSGGPVFDLHGRVIGIHSRITTELDNNYEVAVDDFRKNWTALLKPIDYSSVPPPDVVSANHLGMLKFDVEKESEIVSRLTPLMKRCSAYTIQLSNNSDSSSFLGTLMNIRGINKDNPSNDEVFVIAKNSLISSHISALIDGQKIYASVLYRNAKMDLALIRVRGKLKAGLKVFSFSRDTLIKGNLGGFLLSPLPAGNGYISVIGSLEFALPRLYSGGYLGLSLAKMNDKNIITIAPETAPAAKAGLSPGDEVVTLDDKPVIDPDSFVKNIQGHMEGDTILITAISDGIKKNVQIKLGKRPQTVSSHPADHFVGGRSERRDGYSRVFVHDARLSPAECGGPIFDIQGRFLGLNIARYSRTSSIAISPALLMDFIKEAIAKTQLTTKVI